MIDIAMASEAAARLGVLRFYSADPIARAEVASLLMRMVDHPTKLEWLIRTMIDRIGEWKGPGELRGIYCTRFTPLDGIEEISSIPGFTANDLELDRQRQVLPRKLLMIEAAPEDTTPIPIDDPRLQGLVEAARNPQPRPRVSRMRGVPEWLKLLT